MAQGSKKHPGVKSWPVADKQPRTGPRRDPSDHDRETIAWVFGIVDMQGPWGWRTTAVKVWWNKILPKLQDFESMTWSEIMQGSGGRKRGTNSHYVEVRLLTSQAKRRLAEIVQEDVSQLFSLRLSGTERIYGIREGRVLKLLWYDPHHGKNAQAVYPVKQR